MKQLTYLLSLLGLMFMMASCASNPHEAKEIDTSIENKGKVSGDSAVGVKDGNMIYQRKVNMSEELRRLQYEVYGLEEQLQRELDAAKSVARRAHLEYLLFEIEKFQKDPSKYKVPKAPGMPAGSPIGCGVDHHH